jgi:uncharacterized protein YifE (UPF0438 family)
MWDKIPNNRGDDREKDLRAHYLKPMLDLGADVARFTNTADSAWQIISLVLKRRAAEGPTLIQEEMVDTRRDLIETEAAREVQSDLQKLLTAHKETIDSLRREAEKADNQEMVAVLDQERADIQKQLEKTYKETQTLKIPLSRRFRLIFASKPKQVSVSDFQVGQRLFVFFVEGYQAWGEIAIFFVLSWGCIYNWNKFEASGTNSS